MKKDRIYVLLTRTAKAMKTNVSSVYKWEKDGRFEVVWVGGQRMALRKDVVAILHNWRRSCTSTEAAKLIGAKQDNVYRYMSRGILGVVEMFGRRRVLLNSIPRGKKYFQVVKKRLHKQSLNSSQKNVGHRWTKKEASVANKRSKRLNGVKNGRLITGEKAASILGVTSAELDRLPLRSKLIDDKQYFYTHSVEIYKSHNVILKKKGGVKKK